jgi:hypothetical protein
MESQITVADVAAWQVRCLSQSLDSAIFLSCPSVDHGKISHERCAFDRVFANRRQLNCAFAFANRILRVPEYGINHTKRAKSSGIIGLIAYGLLKFVSRAIQLRASSRLVASRPCCKTVTPRIGEWNGFIKASSLTHI